ncbi:MAG TPA: hypothetical protein VMZ28_11650 [Kofleriaceae bacterium]|nr:hypothetical protein [Kofleriaceae bacterium]
MRGLVLVGVLVLVIVGVSVSVHGEPWRALPGLAAKAGDGRAGVRVEERRAFGDPAAGCYLVEQRVSAPEGKLDAEVAMRSFTEALAARGFTVKRSGGDIEIEGRGVTGRARTVFSAAPGQRAVAVSTTCFHGAREPELCRARCDERLARVVP